MSRVYLSINPLMLLFLFFSFCVVYIRSSHVTNVTTVHIHIIHKLRHRESSLQWFEENSIKSKIQILSFQALSYPLIFCDVFGVYPESEYSWSLIVFVLSTALVLGTKRLCNAVIFNVSTPPGSTGIKFYDVYLLIMVNIPIQFLVMHDT